MNGKRVTAFGLTIVAVGGAAYAVRYVLQHAHTGSYPGPGEWLRKYFGTEPQTLSANSSTGHDVPDNVPDGVPADLAWATIHDGMPSTRAYTLITKARNQGWPAENETVRFAENGNVVAIEIDTKLFGRVILVMPYGRLEFYLANYTNLEGRVFERHELPAGLYGADLLFPDVAAQVSLHKLHGEKTPPTIGLLGTPPADDTVDGGGKSDTL